MFSLLGVLSILFKNRDAVYEKLRSDHYARFCDIGCDLGLDDKYVKYFKLVPSKDCFGWARYDKEEITTTIGRYLKLMFPTLTPAEITHLSEEYKSIVNTTGTFNIIEGQDLVNAYYTKNYYKHSGTLGSSCMRYSKCQDGNYFDVYKDHAKMLIMHPKRGKRIMGRAILWPYKGTYLMDRVYTVESYIEHQFYKYAKENGFYILARNAYVSNGGIQKWLGPEDDYQEPQSINYKIKLDKYYDKLPYMDSVCYLNDDYEISTIPNYTDGICHCAHTTYGLAFRIYG